ncbi:MAG TPA: hypothetical protein VE954_30865 [Oligoflexus sp.]|uniref:hypothetical protein n=1 Tax=Oligoflexus sp. TaxID=1971216 RepID=UPI002D67A970|nr:hypothetical protein [Oligoflexus sp.]HYX37526.1 hypothetical protein [Oligoflexus sp.]
MPRLLVICLSLSGCFGPKSPTKDTGRRPAPEHSTVEQNPIKPTNFQANVEGQSVFLSWDAIAGADKYHMQWAAAEAPHVVLGKASITTPNLKVPDLDEGRYIFQVGQETARGPGPMESLEATVEP